LHWRLLHGREYSFTWLPQEDLIGTSFQHCIGIDLDLQYQKQGDSSKERIYLIGLCPLACAFFRRSSCFSFLDLTLSLASASFPLKGLNIELTSQCTTIDGFILPVLTDFHLAVSVSWMRFYWIIANGFLSSRPSHRPFISTLPLKEKSINSDIFPLKETLFRNGCRSSWDGDGIQPEWKHGVYL
jgi:hypothetical protein